MENYNQLCVWPGTLVGKKRIQEFEEWALKEFGTRVKYEAEIETLPDTEDGKPVEDTGQRNDLFFYVHDEDINKFAVRRLAYGIRWWEDVLGNGGGVLYTKDVLKKYPKRW